MHLNTVLILVGAKIHLRELASLVQFIDGGTIEWQSPKGGGIFGALGKCTPREIRVVGRTQDEDTLNADGVDTFICPSSSLARVGVSSMWRDDRLAIGNRW